MFSYSYWEDICIQLSKHRKCVLAQEILSQKEDDWVVIKHDVETNVSKALAIAKIEAKHEIKATYYVQSYLLDDNILLLKEIASLGHEVTYHYDVLDSNHGDYELALKECQSTIKKFENFGFLVKTVCPHGNPIMQRDGWDSNKDFFRNEEISNNFPDILDLVVHLPKKIKFPYTYISDAGYGWKKIVNIEDNDIVNQGDIKITNLSQFLQEEKSAIIISTHPHRWEKHFFILLIHLFLFKFLRVLARFISRVPLLKKIMSKYYYLAKKI